jgi:hypothetical protein
MEIDGGRIIPTSESEEIAYQRFLKRQEKHCDRDPAKVPAYAVGEPLSSIDSYRLYCSMERVVYGNDDIKPVATMRRIARRSIQAMAQNSLDECQQAVNATLEADEIDRRVVYLASQSVRPPGE